MNNLRHNRNKFISLTVITVGGSLTCLGAGLYNNDEKFYLNIFMPCVRRLFSAETSHRLAIFCAKHSILPKVHEISSEDQQILRTIAFGHQFSSPIGLAAGFDKDGEAITGLAKLGFGFVEVGSVTPKPQPGNSKPRVFRLVEDKAIINRYGFNSEGHEEMEKNLARHAKSWCNKEKPIVVGLNLGKNKDSVSFVDDYKLGLKRFANNPFIDYLVVNISSPNTPGLRDVQKAEHLENFLESLFSLEDSYKNRKRLLIKLSPDLDSTERKLVAQTLLEKLDKGFSIDGLIISNTSTVRPCNLKSPKDIIDQDGGLSGSPIFETSTQMIADMYKLTKGRLKIIGVGGVRNGFDAYQKIRAGASLVQIYTVLTYDGPPVVNRIKKDLARLLRENGFSNVNEAVGIDSR